MPEKPAKDRSRWALTPRLRLWLRLLAVVYPFMLALIMMTPPTLPAGEQWLFALIFSFGLSLVAASLLLGLWGLIRLVLRLLACWPFGRRMLRGGLLLLGCFCLLIGAYYAEEDWRGWHEWNQFRQQWEAKGEHFDLASFVPPPVPDDQNFAFAPVMASCWAQMLDRTGHEISPHNTNLINRLDFGGRADALYDTKGNWACGIKTDFKELQHNFQTLAAKTNLFPVPIHPQSPAADVLLALSPVAPTLEDLRRAAQRPYSRFPLNYGEDEPGAILLPHLAALKRAGTVLELRALAELQTGQTDQALADIKHIERLAESTRNEPILLSHLVRMAMVSLILQPVWEGLADQRWTEPQLVVLDAELARLDFVADYQLAMRGEAGFLCGIIRYLREHPGDYDNLFVSNASDESAASRLIGALLMHLVPRGWYYQNQLSCAQAMLKFCLPVADSQTRTFNPELVGQGEVAVDYQRHHLTPFNIIECQMLSGLGKAAQKFAFAQSSVDLARVAIALERYRLAQGTFPDSLAALEPQFLNPIPHDVIGGQPLHYYLTNDGQFVLYSVGWNETDDGGTVVLRKPSGIGQDISQGDWMWSYRQP